MLPDRNRLHEQGLVELLAVAFPLSSSGITPPSRPALAFRGSGLRSPARPRSAGARADWPRPWWRTSAMVENIAPTTELGVIAFVWGVRARLRTTECSARLRA